MVCIASFPGTRIGGVKQSWWYKQSRCKAHNNRGFKWIRSALVSALGDRRLMLRAGLALVLANVRYWPSVAPLVRTQLSRWRQIATTIPDPVLRKLALQKLRDEHFNAEVAATLATLAPYAHRAHAVEAIVAYEIIYDYLDGLTEQPASDPLLNGHQLFKAFIDAVSPYTPPMGDYYRHHPQSEDAGYLEELVASVRGSLAQLPAAAVIAEVSIGSATRCAEAQVRAHATPDLGRGQLERWAKEEAKDPMDWREFLAGAASSVLSVHALIATAADRRMTRNEAVEIDAMYLSICALSTILDSVIDYKHDVSTGQPGYIQYYDEDHDLLCRHLTNAIRNAVEHAGTIPNGAHHIMTLAGVVAYYTSVPTATSAFAHSITAHVQKELRPLITPTLTVMRTWRAAKQLRSRRPPTTSVPKQ